jgi:hypothetical protein
MQLDWVSMFRRYIADPTKTPYMVAVDRLNRKQANYELFAYMLFVAVIYGVLAVAALSPTLPHGISTFVPLYAFSVFVAAIILGLAKHPAVAAYCASGPAALLIYFLVFGFLPSHGAMEKTIMVAILMLWLRYSWRTVEIARSYVDLPDPPPASGGQR